MISLFSQVWAQSHQLPDRPIAAERIRGAEIGRRKPDVDFGTLLGKAEPATPIEEVFLDDRQTIGKWFDGKFQQEVEYAWRLSPELISRWLGFLQERELLPDEAVTQRWKLAAEWSKDDVNFVVQLCAFPKMPMLELTEYVPPKNDDIDGVRFVIRTEDKIVHCESTLIQSQTAYDRLPAMSWSWWNAKPFNEFLGLEFESHSISPYYPIGDYRCRWFLVTCDRSKFVTETQSAYELVVISRNKKRTSKWK